MAYKAIAGTAKPLTDQTSASHAVDGRSSGDGAEQAGGTQTPTDEAGTGLAGGTQTPTDEAGTGLAGDTQTPTDEAGTGMAGGTQTPTDEVGTGLAGGTQTPTDEAGTGLAGGTQTPTDEAGTGLAGGTQTPTDEAGTGLAGGTQTPTDEAGTGKAGGTQTPTDEAGTGQQENDTLTGLPVNQDQGNGFGDKYPIQETSESPKDFDLLQEIKATLPDGPDQIGDDLRQKKNQKRYRRFLLHVAQNATGKWRKIGESLGIKVNKLESLNADYKHEGSAEQAYQMLVYWRESDNKPTLEKLLLALIDTGLKQVAEQISGTDMLIDRRNRGGKAVTEQLLFEITDDVKDKWKFLGRYLAINESDIHCIKMDNDGNTWEQARQMFIKWKQSNGNRATTGILVNALGDVGKENVAVHVRG